MTIRRTLRRSSSAVRSRCSPAARRAPRRPDGAAGSFHAARVSARLICSASHRRRQARAAKMRAAKIRPLSPAAAGLHGATSTSELRRQTAGIGLDVLNLGSSIVVRIPATFTFDPGSAAVKPQTDATLLEIARTVKTAQPDFVDVLAHTDTSGTPQGQPGAVGEARGRGRDLSRRSWRRQGANRIARARRDAAALQSGRHRDPEGGQSPDRDPAGALHRLAPLREEACAAVRRLRPLRSRRARRAGDGRSAARRCAAPWTTPPPFGSSAREPQRLEPRDRRSPLRTSRKARASPTRCNRRAAGCRASPRRRGSPPSRHGRWVGRTPHRVARFGDDLVSEGDHCADRHFARPRPLRPQARALGASAGAAGSSSPTG